MASIGGMTGTIHIDTKPFVRSIHCFLRKIVILHLLPYLDDLLFACALGAFVAASYMVCPVLGTYILGAAFLASACWAGKWMQSPAAKAIIAKIGRKE